MHAAREELSSSSSEEEKIFLSRRSLDNFLRFSQSKKKGSSIVEFDDKTAQTSRDREEERQSRIEGNLPAKEGSLHYHL